jgi:predicted DsbA family dithiol-disulfide isomerase
MRVDIWSDVVCPWCYLGKRRFDEALESFDYHAEVQVAHRSFQLDPARPRYQTSSRREMLMAKYHLSTAQVSAMDEQMERTAAADGLEYHLTAAGQSGNTLDAHQLVHLASDRGLAEPMLERLYRAYFTEQRSVFDRDTLVELAADAGLDQADARQALAAELYADAVAADLTDARTLGISGVPFVVIDGRYGISGAQSIEVFGQALQRAWEAARPAARGAHPTTRGSGRS